MTIVKECSSGYLTSKTVEGMSMRGVATTRMSSKGQVVIPEEVRSGLGLKEGSQFVVVGERDTVILKMIPTPAMDEFDVLRAKARAQARRLRMKPSAIGAAIVRVRSKR